ncbi:MAG: SDR family NAD(P)-dependent oxidoreductase [Acidimicrobiales bacterium]
MFDLSSRTALVTGAGQSVGQGIAETLAAAGAHVVVNDIVGERADAVAEAITAAGGSAEVSAFDVTDLDSLTTAVDGVGPIDIVVNNAGNGGAQGMVPKPFVDMTPTDWEGPIRVNLYGVLNTTHALLGAMTERGWGRLITISSGAGSIGVGIGVSPYSAAKGGAQAFMRSIAIEVAKTGVTANSVALGLMENVAGGDVTGPMSRGIPVGRLGSPADVAAMCLYLASDEAAWVTGQTMHVNGGNVTT